MSSTTNSGKALPETDAFCLIEEGKRVGSFSKGNSTPIPLSFQHLIQVSIAVHSHTKETPPRETYWYTGSKNKQTKNNTAHLKSMAGEAIHKAWIRPENLIKPVVAFESGGAG